VAADSYCLRRFGSLLDADSQAIVGPSSRPGVSVLNMEEGVHLEKRGTRTCPVAPDSTGPKLAALFRIAQRLFRGSQLLRVRVQLHQIGQKIATDVHRPDAPPFV